MDNTEIQNRFKELTKRIEKLENELSSLRKRQHSKYENSRTEVEKRIVEYVEDFQRTFYSPVKLSALSRAFGKLCKPFGGLQAVLESLVPIVRVIQEQTANRMVYAGSYYDKLPQIERDYINLSRNEREKRIEMAKELQRNMGREAPSTNKFALPSIPEGEDEFDAIDNMAKSFNQKENSKI